MTNIVLQKYGHKGLERGLILPIIRCFLCDTLVIRKLFIGRQLGLNKLIIICTDRRQDCFPNTDQFLASFLAFYCISFSMCPILIPCNFTLLHITELMDICVLISLYVWIT